MSETDILLTNKRHYGLSIPKLCLSDCNLFVFGFYVSYEKWTFMICEMNNQVKSNEDNIIILTTEKNQQ